MNLKELIHESWHPIFFKSISTEIIQNLNTKILPNCSYQPKKENIFSVFQKNLYDINVVILGQDPYPSPGYAIGKAFAISENAKRVPVSLKNIEKEAVPKTFPFEENCTVQAKNWYTLEHWEKQGVFLLNTALTVETSKAGSHIKYWKDFTKAIIQHIAINNPCIWMLWGNYAHNYSKYIHNSILASNYPKELINEIPSDIEKNYILKAPHPAAEAYQGGKAGFFGCNHFYYANVILNKVKNKVINW